MVTESHRSEKWLVKICAKFLQPRQSAGAGAILGSRHYPKCTGKIVRYAGHRQKALKKGILLQACLTEITAFSRLIMARYNPIASLSAFTVALLILAYLTW